MAPLPTPTRIPSGSQRHNLVILFCDVSNSTRIAALMEPERYSDLLQHLREMLTTVMARHGGEIARIDGDGAICIFGYPTSHEDAARRAAEAALDLHSAVASLDSLSASGGPLLRLHSGIHGGVVLLREGDMVRGRFEMLGDATNVAARLADHATTDEIIVSESTLGADRYFFRFGPSRSVRVAGHAEPLRVIQIIGREPAATRFVARSRRGLTPFAGRAPELAQLRAWLTTGEPGPILIVGPAGIGKTRLLTEFLDAAAASGVAVHRGYCEAYLAARPLQPFTHLMASCGRPAYDGAPDLVGAAGGDVSSEGRPEIIRDAIAEAASAGPSVFAIDDWQWADDASRELMHSLAAVASHVRFVLASRTPDPGLIPAGAGRVVELPPLSPAETQAAIAALLPTPDPFRALQIAEQSGGTPLFVEELCHSPAPGAGEIDKLERSAWLAMLIQSRFAKLAPEQAALVRAASVIGHMVPNWLFTATTGVEPDDAAVAKLAEADFLYPSEVGGTLRFKHGLTRDAVYRAIGLDERRALHKRVVEALEAEAARSGEEPLLEALAYHLAAGGEEARAVPYAVRAGDAALAAGALDRAQKLYRSAFDTVIAQGREGPLANRIQPLVNKYGLACIVDPAPDQLPVMIGMAQRLRELGNAEALVRSEYWLGAIAYGLGEGKQSVVHLRAALASARELRQIGFIPRIELKLAQSLFAAGRYDEADALFSRVLNEVAAEPGRIDPETLIYALCCHGFLHADRGDFAAAEGRYREADGIRGGAAPPMLASYLTQKSAVCLFRNEWEAALGHAQLCLEACGRTRARYQTMMANALAAYAQWRLDGARASINVLIGAARWFASGASQQRTSLVYGWLAEIMAETGDAVLARHYAARAVDRVRRAGDRLGEAMAYRAVAKVAFEGGDRLTAARYLAASYHSAAVRGSTREEAATLACAVQLGLASGPVDSSAAAAPDVRGALPIARGCVKAAPSILTPRAQSAGSATPGAPAGVPRRAGPPECP